MQCYIHPEKEAVATCTICGKAICETCAVEVGGQMQCRQCISEKGRTLQKTVESVPTNPLAIISFALGILGLGGCLCGGSIGGLLLGIPAAIVGGIARKQLQGAADTQQGDQLAMAGLILGVVEIIISIVVLILFGAVYGLALFSELGQ